MTEKDREELQLQAIAIKPPIKRPFTLALIDIYPTKIKHPEIWRKHFRWNVRIGSNPPNSY